MFCTAVLLYELAACTTLMNLNTGCVCRTIVHEQEYILPAQCTTVYSHTTIATMMLVTCPNTDPHYDTDAVYIMLLRSGPYT